MSMTRKTFLQSLGVSAAGMLALRGQAETMSPSPALPRFDPKNPETYWHAVRAGYPLADDPLYLNTGGLGPTSTRVLQTVEKTTYQLQEHSETGHELLEPARVTLAKFLGAEADEICFTRNATEANSIIAAGLPLQDGDEVIFESHAHPGGSYPWMNQAKQRGIKVNVFDPDPTSPEENLRRIRALLRPRTKVIQVSHITCTAGLILPVHELARLARERSLWFHIDGAQSVGMIPVNLAEIGCDSYAISGHKWLGGPRETGVLFLRRARLNDVAPTGIGAYSGELTHLPGALVYRAAASRHEYGTRNAAAIVGLAEAVRLQEEIGRERIAERGHQLADRVLDASKDLPGIQILTPRDATSRGSMLTIHHERADAAKLFGYLLKQHRLRCRPVTEQGLQAVRISFHVFNSTADADRVGRALRAASTDL